MRCWVWLGSRLLGAVSRGVLLSSVLLSSVLLSSVLLSSALLGGCSGRADDARGPSGVDSSSGGRDANTAQDGSGRADADSIRDAAGDAPVADSDAPPSTSSPLVDAINAYRVSQGLEPVPFSPSLQTVAEFHATDLANNYRGFGPECNLHSWSEDGNWSGCCYTSDHARASCMWDKPRELTSYPGNGYEISAGGTSSPDRALSAWMRSSSHHDVILNRGTWTRPWGAVGGAIDSGYAVVWFGRETDASR
ncbi:MAG: CAP domain-containing protein [Myxococcota bacterium]